MKKVLLSLIIVLFGTANAATIVPVVWGFALASTSGLMAREIVDEANNIQKKYVFVLESKPGAGGSVSVNYTTSLSQPAILIHSSSYFIRPNMFAEGWYDVKQFNILNNFCNGQAIAFISKNYKTLYELQKQKSFSIGVLPGSITQLLVSEYQKQFTNQDIVIVGYKDTPQMTNQVLGGFLDIGIDWLAGVNNKELNVLAVTGKHNHPGAKTFTLQGIAGFEDMTADFYLMVNKNMNSETVKEFNDIMSKAVDNKRIKDLCMQDFGEPANVTGAAAAEIFKRKEIYWKLAVEKTK